MPEFHLLGLEPREARLDVIRNAVSQAARQVRNDRQDSDEGPQESGDGRLAKVATAGYHLLDPRRRRSLFERVQLLLWTEDDLAVDSTPFWNVRNTTSHTPSRPAPESSGLASSGPEISGSEISGPQRSSSLESVRPAGSSENQKKLVEAKPIAASEQRRLSGDLETQAALDVFRTLRAKGRQAKAIWIGVAALAISLPLATTLVLALVGGF